jgi:ABC-type bacteriocin/lantibiotic exporter with double-glycine peptidase domain
MKHGFTVESIQHVEANQRSYAEYEFIEFKRDLVEAGNQIRIMFMENQLDEKTFFDFFHEQTSPVLTFLRSEGALHPALIVPGKNKPSLISIKSERNESMPFDSSSLLKNENGEITFFAIYSYESPVSIGGDEGEIPSPVRRLFQLLKTEKKEIFYILFYAIVVGLISLIVPLGIQTTVELISGGVIFSSVYLMISLVIVGVLLSGVLQMIQISLVEFLQRRIFTKAAFEFAFRIPRIRLEALQKNYAPELVNRFFDVMTIQKGLPKILIDLSSAVIFRLVTHFSLSPFFRLLWFGSIDHTRVDILLHRSARSQFFHSRIKVQIQSSAMA